jgi:hypothetical protein
MLSICTIRTESVHTTDTALYCTYHAYGDFCSFMIIYNSDVKPANFMTGLPDSAESDTVFLVDFGVATRFLGTFTLSIEKYCMLNKVLYVYAIAMRSLRCALSYINV